MRHLDTDAVGQFYVPVPLVAVARQVALVLQIGEVVGQRVVVQYQVRLSEISVLGAGKEYDGTAIFGYEAEGDFGLAACRDVGSALHLLTLSQIGGGLILLWLDVSEVDGDEIEVVDIVRLLVVADADGDVASLTQSAGALGDADASELHVVSLLVRAHEESSILVTPYGQVLLHWGDNLPFLARVAEAQHGVEVDSLPGGEHR